MNGSRIHRLSLGWLIDRFNGPDVCKNGLEENVEIESLYQPTRGRRESVAIPYESAP